jgi:phosphomannomutase
MNKAERLQGTDGVRGMVVDAADPRIQNDPVAAFREQSLLSPQFVRIYGRAFVEFLKSNAGMASPQVAVGYDPRDTGRVLIEAFMQGIVEGGGDVLDIGVLPTPAVPLYMVHEKLSGGAMITASHNPADQNGIKLFLPGLGLKFFPREDRELTRLVYQHRDETRTDIKLHTGDRAEEARRLFAETMLREINSWFAEDFQPNNLAMIVDCANGACQTVARDVFEPLDLRFVEYVGMENDGSVNENCGAGLYEGIREITGEFMADGGRDFRSVELVQALFRHGRQHRKELQTAAFRLFGAAFDGDGDRFYSLIYDPFRDVITVNSGDEIAYHQAAFLNSVKGTDLEAVRTVATTIESDIAVSAAMEKIGYIPVLTGVGDKWLLWEAACSLFGDACDAVESATPDPRQADKVEQLREEFEYMEEPDALAVPGLLESLEKLAAEEEELDIRSRLGAIENHTFILGSEETGHAVTATFHEGRYPLYCGNGIKSCLNFLAAAERVAAELSGEALFSQLTRPYETGFKATLPIYYTDKQRMLPGADQRAAIEEQLLGAVREALPDAEPRVLQRPEEPGLIYLAIMAADKHGEESVAASVFCRNSGTEAKTSLYIRASQPMQQPLMQAVEAAYPAIAALLIDADDLYARSQRRILAAIGETGSLAADELPETEEEVNMRRLLVEMTLKQGLLLHEGPVLKLSPRGEALLDHLDS